MYVLFGSFQIGRQQLMRKKHESVTKMWERYLDSVGEEISSINKKYTSWHFDNNEKDANELAELVLRGQKRATASSLWVYESDGESIPQEGELSIVTDWNGNAKCVIQTKTVNIKPFKEVDENFARTEGEGDGSLEYWRSVHRRYFEQECRDIGKTFTEDMPVICEKFEVIFQ